MVSEKPIQRWLRKIAGFRSRDLDGKRDETFAEMAEGSLPVLPPSRGRLRRPLTKNDFEEKLWELLTTRDELTAGCVQLVDLMEVHERFIRHWGRIGEMVHMLVQMIISDHLDEGDVYIRVKEHNYAMVFADLSLPEAQEKCAYIAAKISHYLLGTPMDKPGERLQTTALTLDQGMLESGIPLYEAFCQTVEAAKMATAPAFSELQTDPAESEPTAFVELESRNRNGEDSLISNQDFEERLNLACSGTDSEAGCVAGMQVLDIEHIQQHFEAYWDRVGEQVMTVVQMVIQDHLSEGDRYTKWEEKSFLIHFRDKSPEESRAICQRIAKKITQLLEELDEEAHHLAVDHGVVELERVVISQEKRRLSEIERRMREKLSKSADRIHVKSPPKLWTSDQPDAASFDVHFKYWPIWYVRRSIIAAAICLPSRELPDGRMKYGHSLLGKQVNLGTLVDLDEKTLLQVQTDMARMFERGRKLLITCPVHYYTLAKQGSRERYLAGCETIPEWLKRYMNIELVGLPGEISPVFIRDIVNMMRPYCRSVGARFPLGRGRFENLAGSGIHLIGTDIHDKLLPESKIMELMEKFVAGAEAMKMESYIFGLHSLSLVTSALGSGFDYISGPVIQEASSTPNYVAHFEADDLFSHLIARQEMEDPMAAAS